MIIFRYLDVTLMFLSLGKDGFTFRGLLFLKYRITA